VLKIPSIVFVGVVLIAQVADGLGAPPVLKSVYPPGVAAGSQSQVELTGDRLAGVTALRSNCAELKFELIEGNRFRVVAAADAQPGLYDVRAVCPSGVSTARTFFVTTRKHVLEPAPSADSEPANSEPNSPTLTVEPDTVISGKIEKAGDVDRYRFAATAGQSLVIECWAHRIDSMLRAIIVVVDERGQRLASNRGFFGVDPALRFVAPAAGNYEVQVFDLIYAGGGDRFYRLDIGAGPRVVATHPAAVRLDEPVEIELIGWNLAGDQGAGSDKTARGVHRLDVVRTKLTAPRQPATAAVFRAAHQIGSRDFGYLPRGADAPVAIGVADNELIVTSGESRSMESATPIPIPADICGSWAAEKQQHWYALDVRRGETIRIVGRGQRLGAPVDLDVRLLDGPSELAAFRDHLDNPGGLRFPVGHLDGSGSWLAPRDGRFYVLVRNLFTGSKEDARRRYWLRVTREEPSVEIVALARPASSPGAIAIQPGGRTVVDLLAVRQGVTGSIRVRADNLPPGLKCDDVFIGPDVDVTPLVLTAEATAKPYFGKLQLVASHTVGGAPRQQQVASGEMVSAGYPTGRGRLTDETPLAVVRERAPFQVDAGLRRERFQQGSIVDIDIDLRRARVGHSAAAKLGVIGLPPGVQARRATIAAGESHGTISLYIPPQLPTGKYSLSVRVDTTALPATQTAKEKPSGVVAFSNAVSFEVYPAPFVLAVDLDAPRRIHRGETITLNYTAKRKNGFIGKIHTEMAAPGEVEGLRVRGVTFVGQTETGTLQIIANKDAPLGQQPFLRLEGVGTVEDEPVYLGAVFLNLEIVE
jgi:hypothetical protein